MEAHPWSGKYHPLCHLHAQRPQHRLAREPGCRPRNAREPRTVQEKGPQTHPTVCRLALTQTQSNKSCLELIDITIIYFSQTIFTFIFPNKS